MDDDGFRLIDGKCFFFFSVQEAPFYGFAKWLLNKKMPVGYDFDVRYCLKIVELVA